MGRLALFVEQWEKINRQQMGPLYLTKRFQDTIQANSSPVLSSDKAESIFLIVTSRID